MILIYKIRKTIKEAERKSEHDRQIDFKKSRCRLS